MIIAKGEQSTSKWVSPMSRGHLVNDAAAADHRGEYQPGTPRAWPVSIVRMRHNWPLRQLLATLRGTALMVAVVLSLILLQLVPSLIRGRVSGVRGHIARVAIAGVPPEHWEIAVLRMYEALAAIVVLACILFFAQRYLGRKLASSRGVPDRTAQ